ncbi:MAG TPA: hypothetical protein PKK56_01690 [archaeon]|jgi:hypothetical protein|nr:hypothetical protein [archaeon]HPC09978.1 hypothetical protein [archaeon]HRT03725.1 hypothetical protein [Candidatus Diapherotrites archaeon]
MGNIFTKKLLITFFVLVAFIVLIYFLLIYNVSEISVNYLLWAIVFSFIIFFSIHLFLIKINLQNYKRKINYELPFFLNNLANDLERNIPFKLSLQNRIDESLLGTKIKQALFMVDNLGYTLEESLLLVSKDNFELQTIFYQLTDIMQSGTKNKHLVLRTLSDSLVEKQSNDIKKYSSKLNMISLIYVVVSAIVPALFLMFLLVGSNFLEISFAPITIILVTVVLFPLIDMFLLLYMKANAP